MTKKDIAKSIAESSGLSVSQAQEIVQKTMDAIVAALITERRIELRGFGVFEVTRRKARTARNPRTGESVLVPEKLAVTFHPGSELGDRVRAIATQQAGTSDAA